MATNPMQRRTRNSFLLGMLVMLLIASIIIGLLVFLLVKERKLNEEQEKIETDVYVLTQDVSAGNIITPDMFAVRTVSSYTVPSNAMKENLYELESYALIDKNTGGSIGSDQNGLYLIGVDGKNVRILNDNGNYYINVNGQKQAIDFTDVPLVAKVDLKANSVITLDYIAKSDEIASDDLRLQEYTMINLPIKLAANDYIDVRIMLPNGLEYIVLPKKRVIEVSGDAIWLKVTEQEILTMNNAIVEAYTMTGSKLSANIYVEPGLQEAAIPTYAVSQEVYNLIQNDPNIVEKARSELKYRFSSDGENLAARRQNEINPQMSVYVNEAQTNVEQALKEEMQARKELREKYLQDLTSATIDPVN